MLSGRAMKTVLIALGTLAFALLVVDLPHRLGAVWRPAGSIGVGMLFGTFFSVIEIGAFWKVVGLSPPAVKSIQVVAGFVAVQLALVLNVLLSGDWGPNVPWIFVILTLAALVLGLLVAGPLWLLTKPRDIRLRNVRDLSTDVHGDDQQFGIREVLVATATIAVLMGALRWLIEMQPLTEGTMVAEGALLITWMAVFNVFIVLPLLIAPLLRRFALVSTAIGLALIVLATACEVPTFRRLQPMATNHETILLWAMNGTQAAWLLLTLGTLRLGGYRLAAANSVNRVPTAGPSLANPP